MLYWRAHDWSLDDILGLAVMKFRPLHEIYLLDYYTGINVGLSIFRRLISINVHCIYRRTQKNRNKSAIFKFFSAIIELVQELLISNIHNKFEEDT